MTDEERIIVDLVQKATRDATTAILRVGQLVDEKDLAAIFLSTAQILAANAIVASSRNKAAAASSTKRMCSGIERLVKGSLK